MKNVFRAILLGITNSVLELQNLIRDICSTKIYFENSFTKALFAIHTDKSWLNFSGFKKKNNSKLFFSP